MSVSIILKGFDSYLYDLNKAGKDVKKISEKALLESGRIINNAIEKNLNSSELTSETKEKMRRSLQEPNVAFSQGRVVVVNTGFKIVEWNSSNPSGGMIALLNEYGTEQRKTKAGLNRGRLDETIIVRRALKSTASKVRKLQEGVLLEAFDG